MDINKQKMPTMHHMKSECFGYSNSGMHKSVGSKNIETSRGIRMKNPLQADYKQSKSKDGHCEYALIWLTLLLSADQKISRQVFYNIDFKSKLYGIIYVQLSVDLLKSFFLHYKELSILQYRR